MRNTVAVITPLFESEKYIKETSKSLMAQSYGNWRWFLTDDASTDQSVNVVRAFFASDFRIDLQSFDENKGAAVSRNCSISRSSSDFVAFLDSDDLWKSDKLEKQLRFMLDNDLDFSFTAYSLIDDQGHDLGVVIDKQEKRVFTYEDMLRKEATMGCSTVMLRRSAFPNLQMPLIRTGQDYALWLSLLRNGATAHLLPEVLTHYRITPNSISRNKVKKALRQWEIYRKFEGLSVFKSLYYFVHYAYHAVFRR
jgi:teichuronic acid biosynthesis glycosyltransferase TuaG